MHVITGLRTGGAENQLELLTGHTASDPVVVAMVHAEEVARRLRAAGVKVIELGMRSNRDLFAAWRLSSLMREHGPDVVHLHLFRASMYGRVAATLAGVPSVVTTEHSLGAGVLEGRSISGGIRLLYRLTEPLNDVTVAVSREVAERLVSFGLPPRKVAVIPNAVDFAAIRAQAGRRDAVRAEFGIPSDAEVIGGMGRLHPGKRWDVLLRAVAPTLGPGRRVLLAGAGDEEPALHELARSLGVSSWVHFTGTRADVGAVLAAMDVVVSTSESETFGLSVVEACAAGRRVVYVHCPAVDELGTLAGTTRTAGDEGSVRRAVSAALEGPAVDPDDPELRRYDVTTVAACVDALYVESRRTRSRRSRVLSPLSKG